MLKIRLEPQKKSMHREGLNLNKLMFWQRTWEFIWWFTGEWQKQI